MKLGRWNRTRLGRFTEWITDIDSRSMITRVPCHLDGGLHFELREAIPSEPVGANAFDLRATMLCTR